jgi:hypothetical protein
MGQGKGHAHEMAIGMGMADKWQGQPGGMGVLRMAMENTRGLLSSHPQDDFSKGLRKGESRLEG